MSDVLSLLVKAVNGGIFVVAFALLGEGPLAVVIWLAVAATGWAVFLR